MPSGPTPFQARFVTATQQLLALAVVCAALTPAVGVISLDVVAQAPRQRRAPAALMSAYGEEALKSSKLPSGPVSAELREVQLTQPAGSGKRPEPGRRPRHPPRPRRGRAGRWQPADQPAAAGHRLRLGRRHLGPRGPPARRRPELRGAHPDRRHVVGLDDARLPRRARPRPRQRGGPARPARHRPAARRPCRPGTGPRRRARRSCPATCSSPSSRPASRSTR